MTRERLWKRLLYGTQLPSTSDRNKKVSNVPIIVSYFTLLFMLQLQGLERLTYSEFCSLLSLVNVCPLDTMDTRLTVFTKMSHQWYSHLIR